MVRSLAIYPEFLPVRAEVERVEALSRDVFPEAPNHGRACDRCSLAEIGPCLGARAYRGPNPTATTGLVLIVRGTITASEVDRAKAGADDEGLELRRIASKYHDGAVAFDAAVRCTSKKGEETADKIVKACRPFLAQTIEEAAPARIIAIGGLAARSIVGRGVNAWSSRNAFAFLRRDNARVPVFFLPSYRAARRNRFLREWWEQDFARALSGPMPARPPWDAEAIIVDTPRLSAHAVAALRAQRWTVFDVETEGGMWSDEFRIISCAFIGSDNDDVWVWDRAALEDPALRADLLALLEDRTVPKGGANVKYDALAFRAAFGVHVRPLILDTRLQRKLLDPESDGSLAGMAEMIGMGGLKAEAAEHMKRVKQEIGKAFKKKDLAVRDAMLADIGLPPHLESLIRMQGYEAVERFKYGVMPHELLTRYNARDVLVTKHLAVHLEDEIKREPDIHRTWETQVLPASAALERVEAWGMPISRVALERFDDYLAIQEAKHLKVLAHYGSGVNWKSPDQVARVLFNELKLPIQHRTKSGKLSTNNKALKALAELHPLPAALLDHRTVTKLRGTYAGGLIPHIGKDGRIHPNFKLSGTRTGRLSCTDPNLQNQPRAGTLEGKMLRSCYVASRGYVFVEFDYSMIEVRLAAMLSKDRAMIAILKAGVDFHLTVAKLIAKVAWGIEPDDVTDEHRSKAKAVVFGLIYGKVARTFALEWGVDTAVAQRIVDAIMGNFQQLRAWLYASVLEAQNSGFVWTEWQGKRARRRPLFRVADPNSAVASNARNGAGNTKVQGSANEYGLASVAQAVQWIEDEGIEDAVKLVVTVHDSLMFEVREDFIDEVMTVIPAIMTGHGSAGVPIVVDAKIGRTWSAMHKAKIGRPFDLSVLDAEPEGLPEEDDDLSADDEDEDEDEDDEEEAAA